MRLEVKGDCKEEVTLEWLGADGATWSVPRVDFAFDESSLFSTTPKQYSHYRL